MEVEKLRWRSTNTWVKVVISKKEMKGMNLADANVLDWHVWWRFWGIYADPAMPGLPGVPQRRLSMVEMRQNVVYLFMKSVRGYGATGRRVQRKRQITNKQERDDQTYLSSSADLGLSIFVSMLHSRVTVLFSAMRSQSSILCNLSKSLQRRKFREFYKVLKSSWKVENLKQFCQTQMKNKHKW